MKNVDLPLTDAQFYYLSQLAENDCRSLQQLLFVLLNTGVVFNYSEREECLEVLPGDYTEEDRSFIESSSCSYTPRRHAGYNDSYEKLLNLAQSAIDINSVIFQDKDRDVESEIMDLKDLNKAIDERNKQKHHKQLPISDS